MRSSSAMRLLYLALTLLCVEQAAAGSLRPIGTMRKRSLAEQQPVSGTVCTLLKTLTLRERTRPSAIWGQWCCCKVVCMCGGACELGEASVPAACCSPRTATAAAPRLRTLAWLIHTPILCHCAPPAGVCLRPGDRQLQAGCGAGHGR